MSKETTAKVSTESLYAFDWSKSVCVCVCAPVCTYSMFTLMHGHVCVFRHLLQTHDRRVHMHGGAGSNTGQEMESASHVARGVFMRLLPPGRLRALSTS